MVAKRRMTVKRSKGGRPAVKHKYDKPSSAVCALCRTKLHGVPRLNKSGLRKLSKTEKRPERKYGGVLCHACVTALTKEKARLSQGTITTRDIDLRHLKYIKATK